MTAPYTLIPDIASHSSPPANGTLSSTLYQDERLKAVLFNFSAGQELSEHTASTPAVIHVINGEADLTLGADRVSAGPGTWVHMSAQLPHSIQAKTPLTMLLLLLKQP